MSCNDANVILSSKCECLQCLLRNKMSKSDSKNVAIVIRWYQCSLILGCVWHNSSLSCLENVSQINLFFFKLSHFSILYVILYFYFFSLTLCIPPSRPFPFKKIKIFNFKYIFIPIPKSEHPPPPSSPIKQKELKNISNFKIWFTSLNPC